ncbi:MAG: hypothetical protein ACREKE_02445, partial [bacterium]
MRRLAHLLGLKDCPECETLVEYAMDGLAVGQQGKVRKHLSDCPRCREQVRDYWQVTEGLGLCADERDVPEGLCDKVLARLREVPPPQGSGPSSANVSRLSGWPRFWSLYGPAFAALSLAMTLVAMAALARKPALIAAPAGNELSRMARAVVNDPRAVRVPLVSVASAVPGGSAAGGLLVLCPG